MNIHYQFESVGPALRYVVLVFLIIAALVALAVIVGLAALPGQIARRCKHPQKDAINICGWLGLPTGILWVFAMVWAYWRPLENNSDSQVLSAELEELLVKLNKMENAIVAIESQRNGAKS